MAIDDRERNFEKALGRELRSGGESGLDCPDAETLAAYHERMLSPEEMAAQKSHIAACAHCQEILAALEVTEAIPSVAEDSEKLVAQIAAVMPASPKSAIVREMPKRKIYLRWAVPAGAIAAGLLVWIAISSNRQLHVQTKTAPAPVEVAENRESGDARLAAPKQQPAEMERQKAPVATMADRENDKLNEEYEFKAGDSTVTAGKEKPNSTRSYAHGPRAMQNQMQQNQAQNQIQNNGQFSARSQSVEAKRQDETPLAEKDTFALAQNAPRKEAQLKKANPSEPATQPPASTPPALVGGAAGAGSGAKAEEKGKDASIGAVSQTVTVESESAYVADEQKVDADKRAALLKLKGQMAGIPVAAATNLRDAKAGAPGFVGTPDPQVFWFFLGDGIVFRTEDGGQTKKIQKTGVVTKFVAGSAPDKKTCWLLAENGIVVRTTNAGKNWTTVTAPPNYAFTMITAVDAKNALVTDAVARVSYATSDGGATWKVVPQP